MWHSISWFLYVLHYLLVVILYWLQAVQYCTAYTCNIAHISYVHILSAYVVCIFYLLFGVLATLGFFFIFYLWAKFVSYSISWSAWVQLKTWWNTGEIHKPGENLVKTWCFTFNPTGVYKLDENLVKIWWKPGENLVKTWWNLNTCLNYKTWRKPGEI